MRTDMQYCLEQGMTRQEIFAAFQGQGVNDMRLAKQVATLVTRQRQEQCWLLNWMLALSAISLAIVVVLSLEFRPTNTAPLMLHLVCLVIVGLTAGYVTGFFKLVFDIYAFYIFYSAVAAGVFIIVFEQAPVAVLVGTPVALINVFMAVHVKREIFPHMGLMDIRQAANGRFILGSSKGMR